MRTRAEAIDYLGTLIGLSADPADPGFGFFRDLVAHEETDARASQIMAESTCALAVRGYLRWTIPPENWPALIQAPYRDTQAPRDVQRVAIAAGAIRSPASYKVVPGDIVHLAKGPGGPEHVYMVRATDDNPYGGTDVDSVDAGQKRGIFQAVKARQRVIVPKGSGAEDQEIPEGGGAFTVRPVWLIYDWEAIARFFSGE